MYYFIGDIFMNEENLIKYYNKFNEDKREQIMSLDYNQKQLLQHLLEESENILYENDSIKIKVKEGHTLCSIQTSKDVKSTITHCNDEIIIDIAKV